MTGYDEQTWVNGESQANAQRFNHMEAGIKNAYNVSLIAITNIEPSEYNEGDKYYNTSDNLIYIATSNNEWSETGETPISDKTYVLIEDGSTYMYDGTTLTRIGGSEQEVENEYSESTTLPYSANYINDKYGRHILYDNDDGTRDTVILSESASNYEYIEVYFFADGYYNSIKVPTSISNFAINIIYTSASTHNQFFYTTDCTLSGNTITQDVGRNNYISSNNTIATYGNNVYIKICRVIGYK